MKIKADTGTIHKADIVDTKYFDDIALSKCGREFRTTALAGVPASAEVTSGAVTCKSCKRSI
ncbi:MAG: hypothetical protein JSW13_01715 [Candidatus Aerophobus sp.]|nr:MAG: hypothetical protein JSW13_01715 [Candidatus Aerophobus sp.]